MCFDGHQQTEAGTERNHGGSAITDERQRYAHDRQNTAYHADVYEDIEEESEGQRACQNSFKGAVSLFGDIDASEDDVHVYGHQEKESHHSEFLTVYRKDEVRMVFRQKVQLGLGAVQPALSVYAAGSNGYF